MDNLVEPQKWEDQYQLIERARLVRGVGKIQRVTGLLIESVGPEVTLGEICYIITRSQEQIHAEVVGFRDEIVILMPFGSIHGVAPGSRVISTGSRLRVKVGEVVLGRVIDPLGQPLDGKGAIECSEFYEVDREPPNPIERPPIDDILTLGIRSIDGCLTCGSGQRLGVFAGSGVGKSTLMGMIARNTEADINVIALVGERGREVREFIEKSLGEEGLKRSVVVVATSSEPAIVRLKAAFVATAIAEYFRDQGLNVMLMMDSVTRFALAQRELGLSIGEPPTTRGYPPSVFQLLPRLFERAGRSAQGTITGFYTVLVEGGDMDEPVADAVRGLLDGHIVLSRDLAQRGHFPAISILESTSRLMFEIIDDEHIQAQAALRELLAAYEDARDLINIGAYQKGSNRKIDTAIEKMDQIEGFLRQHVYEKIPYSQTVLGLKQIVE
jgi:flagellum-specific ATP synthase